MNDPFDSAEPSNYCLDAQQLKRRLAAVDDETVEVFNDTERNHLFNCQRCQGLLEQLTSDNLLESWRSTVEVIQFSSEVELARVMSLLGSEVPSGAVDDTSPIELPGLRSGQADLGDLAIERLQDSIGKNVISLSRSLVLAELARSLVLLIPNWKEKLLSNNCLARRFVVSNDSLARQKL